MPRSGSSPTSPDDCLANDIGLFLEPLSYALDGGPADRRRPAPGRGRDGPRLTTTGADVLKAEFPYDAA
jgi:tagatose-1,6-bisphosphate aldolase